ncbi:MAG: ABC transporter ATP-binding protein [Flaviflexus sp.]|nr:ABC transporter ATP-binding protein [Flaviflexus sp.]
MLRTLTTLIARACPGKLTRLRLFIAGAVVCEAAASLLLVPLLIHLVEGSGAVLWLGLLALAVAGTWLFGRVAQDTALDIGFDLLSSVQGEIAAKLRRLPASWLSQRTEAATSSLSGVGPDLVGSVGYLYAPLLSAFALPPVIGLGLLAGGLAAGWGPWLGLACLVSATVAAAAWHASIHIGKKADKQAEMATRAVGERALELASQQRTLRTCGRGGASGLMAADVRTERVQVTRLIAMQIPAQILFSFASQAALFAIIATAGWQWHTGVLPGAAFIALIALAVRLLEPITQLANLSATVGRIGSIVEDARELFAGPETPVGSPADTPPAVSLRSVSHGYDSADVITNLDLDIPAGQSVALIGPSGSGKSTLLHLISGLEQPRSGEVLIDNEPAAPGRASVIFQFPYLFDMTIEENIAAGTHSEEIPAAATEIVDFAADLPAGLDTPCGEAGRALSGGERQRVSIARALAHPSRLILVDEATSALDAATEAVITERLAAGGHTRVTIAHRPAAIRTADRVLIMEGGRIIADGSPDELADHPYLASLLAGLA